MKTFYIFKITKEFKILTKKDPYNLYLALDSIRSMNAREAQMAFHLFDEICDLPNTKALNLKIFNYFKDSDYYMKFNNSHIINNYFTTENSKLTVNRSYLKLKSTIQNPTFFKSLQSTPNLFVIDFSSKNYFWLS